MLLPLSSLRFSALSASPPAHAQPIEPQFAARGWEVHRPNPPGDGDDQPVGNFLVWDPDVWLVLGKGAFLLSPRTRIQPEAAGPTFHRIKYLVWARLEHCRNGMEWTFASAHFVPSKPLGGAAVQLWKLQRDNLLTWWAGEPTDARHGGLQRPTRR